MNSESKKKMRNRLSRIEGQIRGITRLLDEGASVVDMSTQIRAVRSALSSIEQMMLEASFENLKERVPKLADAETEKILDQLRYLIKK